MHLTRNEKVACSSQVTSSKKELSHKDGSFFHCGDIDCSDVEVAIVKIFFARHGKDDDRYRGGWSNHDLIPEGIAQAKKLAKHLKENKDNYNITQIISSDLPRTLTTAYLISAELGLAIQRETQLRETNNGDMAGMLNTTALEQYPGIFFSSLKMDEPYPNGESPNDFYFRVKEWLSGFCSKCSNIDGNVLVVTHSGVINVIYHLVNNIKWTNKGRVYEVSNCSLHILDTITMKFEVENRTDFLTT